MNAFIAEARRTERSDISHGPEQGPTARVEGHVRGLPSSAPCGVPAAAQTVGDE